MKEPGEMGDEELLAEIRRLGQKRIAKEDRARVLSLEVSELMKTIRAVEERREQCVAALARSLGLASTVFDEVSK